MNRQRTTKILCTILAAGMAASSVSTKPENSPAVPPANARQQLLDLEREWVEAENRHDAAALQQILDDKFLVTSGVNPPRDKAAFIKQITAGEVDPALSQTLSDETVILDRDTAVVIGTDTVRGTANGLAYVHEYRYTATYIHRNGRWLALAEHLVAVPKTKQD